MERDLINKIINKNERFVLGADFGTDSVRVVIVDAFDGETIGTHVSYYERWSKGLYSEAKENIFRQHPKDYMESFTEAVVKSLKEADKNTHSKTKDKICSICIDTTGSTPALADINGMPLALNKKYEEEPDAMFVLWKDHSAVKEAFDINEIAKNKSSIDYTLYSGGVYSSEWFWAKALHIIRKNKNIYDDVYTIVEHSDWITALLCGNTKNMKRGKCAAGHKCMYNESWGGYPPKDFFNMLNPKLGDIRDTLEYNTYTAEDAAGKLCKEWALKLNLNEGTVVGMGIFDAPAGFVGAGAGLYTLVKSIGTSTCDFIIGEKPKNIKDEIVIKGICGQVYESVVKGYIAYEAGQSAYGDYYAWFRNMLMWGENNIMKNKATQEKLKKELIKKLEEEAEKIEATENSPVALDWINGRRTPFANQNLKASIFGLSLGVNAPSFMKMLLESTAYGARAIIECFEKSSLKIEHVIAVGGVAKKSPLGMQILSDVTNKEIHVASVEQAAALGAAIYASVSGGIYKDVFEAQQYMCRKIDKVYKPKNSEVYNKLYAKYISLSSFTENETHNT